MEYGGGGDGARSDHFGEEEEVGEGVGSSRDGGGGGRSFAEEGTCSGELLWALRSSEKSELRQS